MKIALVSQEYPPETAHGGIASQVYIKAHGLCSLGHDVWVISHSLDDHRHEYKDGSVSVIRVPGYDHRMNINTDVVRWLTYSAEVASALAHLNKQVQLDLADFPEWGAEAYVHLLNQVAWDHLPTVIHLQGPLAMFAATMGWPDRKSTFYQIASSMEATCLRLADRVFSSSQCSANWCSTEYNIDLTGTPVIHSGVDTSLFYPHKVEKADHPTIVFVGKLVENKGVKVLLEAAIRLAPEFPGLQLRILGTGEEAVVRQLEDMAAASNTSDLLVLEGFVDRTALPRELSMAHVFAAPSFYEGGPGFVYLEAMACGLPVVGCEGSGVAEIVTHEENGLLVSARDVESLMSALRCLLKDQALREEMGNNALKYVIQEADSRICLQRLQGFYTSTISSLTG